MTKHFQRNFTELRKKASIWQRDLEELLSNPDKKKLFDACFQNSFQDLSRLDWHPNSEVATRQAFGDVLENWADKIPGLIGGSADLEPSNMTCAFAEKVGDFKRDHREGRNLAFGVREFPMSAIANGLALYGGFVPFDATFLSFADYSRPALRLGAIQKVRVIHELTHDSFHLGEDGPTHQPIEHLMALRVIPDLLVIRPADARETEVTMEAALREINRPSAICLSRQKLPLIQCSSEKLAEASRGAYIVQGEDEFELIIMATGSEVSLAMEAAKKIARKVRIISMPCLEWFEEQDSKYR